MDPGRVLQHQGRHPERDDRSAQVPGRGTHCNDKPSHNPITELSKKCVCHIWTDSNCRKWNKERDGRGETRGWSERSSSSEAGDRNGHLCDTECSQLLQALEEGGGQVETVSWCIRVSKLSVITTSLDPDLRSEASWWMEIFTWQRPWPPHWPKWPCVTLISFKKREGKMWVTIGLGVISQSFSCSSNVCSVSVLCCRGHAHHGHCAASGQVLSAQEANYRRRRGPHLALPEGPVRVLTTYEWHFQ